MIVLKWYLDFDTKEAKLNKVKNVYNGIVFLDKEFNECLIEVAKTFFGSDLSTDGKEVTLHINKHTPQCIINDENMLIGCLSEFFTEALPFKSEFEPLPF